MSVDDRPAALMDRGASLRMLRAAGSPHLHLVHPGGGGIDAYRRLAAQLPAGWTVSASDDAGRGDSVEALAGIYLRSLLRPRRMPDLLGGWSLGGLIGFEMARLLRAARHRPPTLVLLDTPPPGSAGPMPGAPRVRLEFAGMMWASLGVPPELFPPDLPDDDEAAMLDVARRLRGAGEPVEPELLLERLGVYRRHRRALCSYAPGEPLDAQALIVRSTLDDAAIDAWRGLLARPPQVATLPGGHYDVLGPVGCRDVARFVVALARS